MVDEDVLERIRSLTHRQKQVLERICKGMQYKDIADEFVLSENTIKTHVGNLYIKLGLEHLPPNIRRNIIIRTYCEALKEFKSMKDEKVSDEFEEPEEPEPISEEIMETVENDQKALVYVEPEVIDVIPPVQPKKKRRRRNRWKWILALIIIFLLAFGGFKLYEFVTDFIGSLQIQAAPVQEEEQEPVAQVLPTNTTQPPEPTARPTNTVIASTNTLQPTPPPTPAILFSDDFSAGLSSGWQVVYGNPLVVNDMLTTDQNTLLMIGDPSWKNYSIEFTADPGFCWLSRAENWVLVRAENTNNMYAYKWGECESYWFIVKNGVWNEVPQSDYNPGWETSNFRIEVEGGSMSVYGNGLLGSSIFDNTYTEGRIGLMIGENTTLDDFVVREIE